MKSLITLLLFGFCITTSAQNSCACCTPAHDAFDFWIGDWEVFSPQGGKVGENSISNLEENCIISEQWIGASGTTGKSYSYFNPADNSWNQVWIDNKGSHLILKGKEASENVMILQSAPSKNAQGQYFYSQVTWSKNEDGTVRQLWELYDTDNNLLSVAFDGLYKPRKKQKD